MHTATERLAWRGRQVSHGMKNHQNMLMILQQNQVKFADHVGKTVRSAAFGHADEV